MVWTNHINCIDHNIRQNRNDGSQEISIYTTWILYIILEETQMVSDKKLKWYEERITKMKNRKISEIKEKYPTTSIKYEELINNPKVKPFSCAILKSKFLEHYHHTCFDRQNLNIRYIFDFSRFEAEIQDKNKENEAIRDRIIDLIDGEAQKIIDIAYLGKEEELLDALTKFDTKDFV